MKSYEEKKDVTSGIFSWRVGVLMALCFLHQARGHVQLLPPQNVTLLSRDFEMILTWAPGEGSPQDVTYTVTYKTEDHMDKWLQVPHCNNITRTSCILTCVRMLNIHVKVRARVKAVSGRLQSPWVKSQFKDYYSAVELAPPVLILNVKENSIHVSASFPLPTCMEKLIWKYELHHWEAGSEDRRKYEDLFRKDSVTIDTTALRGNYCLSARSVYESTKSKYSEFSQPVCVPLNHKAVKFPLSATIPVFVLPIFLIGAFILCFLKQDAKQRKMPQALDFRHFQAAGSAFPSEISEKEFCSDYLNCTEKPMAQRNAGRALARNNLPRVASFLSPSSSDDDDEEEEEEEDSGTFIRYNQVTRFPRRHLNCQSPQAAQGKTSLDSGTGGLSVDSESVLDLSTSGFSSCPGRRDEVDTSGSKANEETSPSLNSSLGRISLADVRFPGFSEQHEADGGGSLEMTLLQPLMEGVCAKGPPGEHHPHEEGHHFTTYYQKSVTDLQVQIHGISQLKKDPNIQLLIPLHTLQVAEDEGISSDCDSDSFTQGTPPSSTVLSDTFEPSNMGDKYNPKFQFKGYSHAHYLGRT